MSRQELELHWKRLEPNRRLIWRFRWCAGRKPAPGVQPVTQTSFCLARPLSLAPINITSPFVIRLPNGGQLARCLHCRIAMVKKKGKGRAKPVPTLMEPDPRNITLFGWVLDVSNSAFLVHIEHSMTVSHLKEAIKKKKPVTFANVDADQLKLWKVSGFSPLLQDYALKSPTRSPSRSRVISRTKWPNTSFSTKICCWG